MGTVLHTRLDYANPNIHKKVYWPTGTVTTALPLYHAEALATARPGATVVVTEGEPACDALTARGVLAVGTVTGAASIPNDDSLRVLLGFDVALWPDNDEPGRKHMGRIADRLTALGGRSRIVVWPDAPKAGDAANCLCTDAELRALVSKPCKYRLLWDDGMESTPEPEPLVGNILARDSFGVCFGAPGVGKSFVALDMALCIGSGIPWHGHAVAQGPVVYIAGEGMGGIKLRVNAWKRRHGIAKANVAFVRDAVNLLDTGDVSGIVDAVADLPVPPQLIVVDTLARSMVGGEENGATDMGVAVAAADTLRKQYGASVLIVHHAGKSGELRGSTALAGAADTMFKVTKADRNVTITCTKQKNAEGFPAIGLKLFTQELGANSRGEEISSAVLVDGLPVDREPVGYAGRFRDLLRTHPEGRTTSQVQAAIGGSRATVNRAAKELGALHTGPPKAMVWSLPHNASRVSYASHETHETVGLSVSHVSHPLGVRRESHPETYLGHQSHGTGRTSERPPLSRLQFQPPRPVVPAL
ncbi:MAG TPA: AAA family ATPase [Candidatus Binatia bacterium]|nr:AAA family ATPase [Candidatus Binatia bacterium]